MRQQLSRWTARLISGAAITAAAWAGPANAFVLSSPAGGGWDGPGLNSHTINWYLGNHERANNGLPAGLNLAEVEAQVVAAMATWSSAVQITFNKIGDYTDGGTNRFQPNSIDIYWAAGDHFDGSPFDGTWNPGTGVGNVLAHGFGPPDDAGCSGEPACGNIHLDADETWVTAGAAILAGSATIDVQTVLLHELGHALGLGHEDGLGSGLTAPVMQSFYWGELRSLTADDIAGIQQLYCPAGQVCGTAPEPATWLLLASALTLMGYRRRQRGPV